MNNNPENKWTQGQSGNPRGRPKGVRLIGELVREFLGDVDLDAKKARNQVILEKVYQMAILGDIKATALLWAYGFGKPTESIEHKIETYTVVPAPPPTDENAGLPDLTQQGEEAADADS